MELYLIILIIFGIIVILLMLFILIKFIFKNVLKLSLFTDSNVSKLIFSRRESSNEVYQDHTKSKRKPFVKTPETSSLENKDEKVDLVKKDIPQKVDQTPDGKYLSKIKPMVIPGTENLPAINLNNYKEIYNSLTNQKVVDIVHFFEINSLELLNKLDLNKKISTTTELEEFIKNKIINFLNNKFYDLKDKLSDLRKEGKNVRDIEFATLSVPLKIKLFSATFSKKDFELIIKKIDSIQESLKNYK